MKVQFLGAAGEVTGSCYYLEHGETKFLVDCGMFQGSDSAEEKNRAEWPFDPSKLEFVLLTHAHFDHTGRLPKLYHDGFRGKIYTTAPTAELADLILSDSADLMFHEAKLNHEHTQPLYTLNEVKALNAFYRPVQYNAPIRLTPEISATFHDAGHILGSAIIVVEVEGKKIVFSGDLGNDPVPLMNTPERISAADVVFVESTYGDRLHDKTDRVAALKQAVLDTVAQKGTLIIPAFALERTQELLFHFNALRDKNEIPDIPIYVDSPLAIEATAVFRRYENLFDAEAKAYLDRGDDFFQFKHLKYCTTVEESKALNFIPSPKVIIAGSGMMNGGRVLHHLVHYGMQKNTIICIVGFQVPGCIGRQLLDGERHIHVMHQWIDVAAEVRNISAFSAHADQQQLLDWIGGFADIKKMFIIHGEVNSGNIFGTKVTAAHPAINVHHPQYLEVVEL